MFGCSATVIKRGLKRASLPYRLKHCLHGMGTALREKPSVFKIIVTMSQGNERHEGCRFLPRMEGRKMKKTFGSALIALAFVFGLIAATSTPADAQWSNRTYGGNNQQIQQGFQYGVNTGASDAQRRQAYSPQRSRYYQEAPNQAFRGGFVRGYEQRD